MSKIKTNVLKIKLNIANLIKTTEKQEKNN
jgi:hypothetical protein